jgi:energy-coupling factor transporter ATP-binding protein EcfA2
LVTAMSAQNAPSMSKADDNAGIENPSKMVCTLLVNIALQRYQGTVLLVTHDHDLIDEVATRIWHFESDHKITDFKGTYEEYQKAAVAV